ncbi:hypothetical protein Arub01_45220 [Actinomadura rubrobrunea]|uniref:Uncharacterized protein n=1 Tax=Actinomadura rubrobrunea TaxID=115335 RepID=A0A9W6Q0M0_9ACTN|nr:DUF2500 family protein [Actinomadura rubrobrunea]GLW66278.1 hypothetical protein Arub01_45220 [Actinomadura rubrobrunea]
MWNTVGVAAARLAIGGVGLLLAITFGEAASQMYDDMRSFKHAPHCESRMPGDQRECVATVTVTVVDRSVHVDRDDPPHPVQPPPAPPPPPPMPPFIRLVPVAANAVPVSDAPLVRAAAASTTHYYVTIRMPDGKRRELKVGKKLYDQAEPGTSGRAQVWRGHVTRLAVGTESKRFSLFIPFFLGWMIAWAGLLLFLGALFYPIGESSGYVFAGWYVAGVAVFYLLKDWRDAMFVVPAVVGTFLSVQWLLTVPLKRDSWSY